MRNVVVAGLALGVALAGLGAAGALRAQEESGEAPAERVIIERRALLDRIERVRDDLVVVDEHLAGRQTAAHDAVDRMRRELREIRKAVQEAPRAPDGDAAGSGGAAKAMSAEEFADLHESFRSATFRKPQVEIARQIARHGKLTSDQVAKLVKDAFDDGTQVEVATLLYPCVTDREHYFRVVDLVRFEASRERLREALKEIDERE